MIDHPCESARSGRLVRKRPVRKPHADQPVAAAGPKAAGLFVLVVEDDEGDAYLIERALRANLKVRDVFRTSESMEALRLVQSGAIAPDLALIDLHMPRKNGFELLADFAALSRPHFPMVVLTSSTPPTQAMRRRLRGAMSVLAKPDSVVALEQLLAKAVTSACTGRAAQRIRKAVAQSALAKATLAA
jgi:CheY-like chemotaxis protein